MFAMSGVLAVPKNEAEVRVLILRGRYTVGLPCRRYGLKVGVAGLRQRLEYFVGSLVDDSFSYLVRGSNDGFI